jgi:hypothetical protein
MNLRPILALCVLTLLAGACQKRDASLVASAPAPAAAAAPAEPAAPAPVAAPAEPVKDNSWAGQVNQAKSAASAQGNAAQDRAEKADAVAK